MRAAQIVQFGDWRTVAVGETAIPTLPAGHLLVRVRASSLNAVDRSHRAGRLALVAGRRMPQGLGIDMVGVVERVGADGSDFRAGDRVWGIRAGAAGMRSASGSTAQYAVVDARRAALAPDSLDDVGAAALVIGGYTALRALRDAAGLQRGERVLVRGGTGAVGSAAVQIARALGGRVAVLASGRNEQLARSLGAHEFFDYATTRPSDVGPVDVVLDTVGTHLLPWRRVLAPHGRMVGIAFESLVGLGAIGASMVFGSRRVRTFAGQPPAGFLAGLTRFVDTHGIHPVVQETFPLDRVQDAYRAFDAAGVQGRIVITVAP